MSDVTDRIRKLLNLSRSANEHEAAAAAARAAALMAEHEITEAMVAERDTSRPDADVAPPEAIIESGRNPDRTRRVAWQEVIASALGRSLDCETYLWNGRLCVMGRESNVRTWEYTRDYLWSEVNRLADAAWLTNGADLAAVGQVPRQWKAAFRLGAADTIAARLQQAKREREAQRRTLAIEAGERLGLPSGDTVQSTALALVDRALARVDADRKAVREAFQIKTKGWRASASIGAGRRGSGYGAGREAGKSVSLSTSGAKRLGA